MGLNLRKSKRGISFIGLFSKHKQLSLAPFSPGPIDYLIFTLIALIVYLVYRPGLTGGFLFDDMVNFQQIKYFSEGEGLDAWINYIFSNPSGMLKRPISTLSFLLNSTTVPTSAYYFKLTNIVLHIFNAFLLFIFTRSMLKIINVKPNKILILSLFATLFWALNPYFVSTVLYSVQRMAILTTFFIIFGMILYCKGRLLLESHNSKGHYFLIVAVFIMTALATLSKENGVLLPFYLYLLEVTVFKKYFISKLNQGMKVVLFYLPILAVITALAVKYPGFILRYESRDFSLTERLLTESRVMVYYIYNIFLPAYFTEGIFSDVFAISKGIFQPLTTLFSIIFHASIILISIGCRKRLPIFSFAALFFYLANVIESTIVPLEIYFEHRAYLATIFLPLLFFMVLNLFVKSKKVFYLISIALMSYLSFTTFLKSNIWGNNFVMITQSAKLYPHSIRAINYAAIEYSSLGLNSNAKQILLKGMEENRSISLEANLYALECQLSQLSLDSANKFKQSISSYDFKEVDTISFMNFIKHLLITNCFSSSSVSSSDFASELLTIFKNKIDPLDHYANSRIMLYQLFVAVENNKFEDVLEKVQRIIVVADDFYIYSDLFLVIDILDKYNQKTIALKVVDLIKNSKKIGLKTKYYFIIKDDIHNYTLSLGAFDQKLN